MLTRLSFLCTWRTWRTWRTLRTVRKTAAVAATASVAVLALVLVQAAASPSLVHAQDETIQANFKGAVGVGLIGAELGAVIPALAGVDATWAYLVFPAVGAAGGAVAGYFLLDNADRVDLSIAALTAGMGLVIPALIATLQLTAYDDGDEVDEAPPPGTFVHGPDEAEGGGLGQQAQHASQARRLATRDSHRQQTLRRARKQLAAGTGMVRLSDGRLALAAPGFALLPSTNGNSAISGVAVSLMSGHF